MGKISLAVCALLFAGGGAGAAVVGFDQPALDVWMYENGFDRGFRENAPVFGGPTGANGSDDRLGQLVMGWNTQLAGITPGLGAASYAITRVTFRATHVNDQVFAYDPTYDSYRSHLATTDPSYIADADIGRPLELFGLGLRNGYTSLATNGAVSATKFGEATTSFGAGGAGEHHRHAFAWAAGTPRLDGDVSENVTEQFEVTPFGIGITNAVTPGELVPEETEFTFELNLADPTVLAYLRAALNAGQLGLTLSSLHPSSFDGLPGAQTYPRFFTGEYFDFVPELVPKLEIEYHIIPEPATMPALLVGVAALAMTRAWRRRDRFS